MPGGEQDSFSVGDELMPGVTLQSIIYADDNGLQLTAAVPGQAELAALQQRVIAASLLVTPGGVRDGGGRQIADFGVRAP